MNSALLAKVTLESALKSHRDWKARLFEAASNREILDVEKIGTSLNPL